MSIRLMFYSFLICAMKATLFDLGASDEDQCTVVKGKKACPITRPRSEVNL